MVKADVYKMETEWNEEAISKLIELYEKEPILYDPSNHSYQNVKGQKENEIAHILDRNDE